MYVVPIQVSVQAAVGHECMPSPFSITPDLGTNYPVPRRCDDMQPLLLLQLYRHSLGKRYSRGSLEQCPSFAISLCASRRERSAVSLRRPLHLCSFIRPGISAEDSSQRGIRVHAKDNM